jgi:Zn-dependent protease
VHCLRLGAPVRPESFIFYGCLLVAVILHEISHGVVALFYGDDTAKRAGRLTLNPIPHIDPVGSVLLPAMAILASTVSGYRVPILGWAKPVPVSPSRLRNPRRQMLFVGLIGPTTNFALMIGSALVARSLPNYYQRIDAHDIFAAFAAVNLFLGVFNLLPIPPLDGSSLIERVLPHTALPIWYRIRPYGFLVLFLGLFYFNFFGRLIDASYTALLDFMR